MARSAAGPPSTSAADAKAAEREAAGGGARARTPARSAVASAADAAHSRGYALRKQGNFLGAVEAYSEAIQLQPGHFKALFNRAFSYDKVLAWLLWVLVWCMFHHPGLCSPSTSGRSCAVGPVGKRGGGLWQGAARGAKEQLCALQSRARWRFQHGAPLAIEVAMPTHLPCPLALSCDCRITRDRLGNYSGAVEDFSAAILLDDRNADFYHNRGFSQRKQVLTHPSFGIGACMACQRPCS